MSWESRSGAKHRQLGRTAPALFEGNDMDKTEQNKPNEWRNYSVIMLRTYQGSSEYGVAPESAAEPGPVLSGKALVDAVCERCPDDLNDAAWRIAVRECRAIPPKWWGMPPNSGVTASQAVDILAELMSQEWSEIRKTYDRAMRVAKENGLLPAQRSAKVRARIEGVMTKLRKISSELIDMEEELAALRIEEELSAAE